MSPLLQRINMSALNAKTYLVEVEGYTPLLMHKFIGIPQSKRAKELPEGEQAERFTYRNKTGDLAIPTTNIRGCIVEAFVDTAPNKKKTATKKEVAPRIRVESCNNDKLYATLNPNEYDIDVRSVPSGSGYRGGVRDFCVRPIIDDWTLKFKIIHSLDLSEKDLQYKLKYAGMNVGLLSNRPNGYGRFNIVNIEKVT